MRSRRRLWPATLLLVSAAASACGDSTGTLPPAPVRQLVLSGRAERGLTLTLGVRDGSGAPVTGVTIVRFVVSPTDAATALGDSALLLRRAGAVSVSATLSDGTTRSATTTVTTPPLIVFGGVAGNNADVYSAAVDGGDLTRLTTSAGTDVAPTSARGTVVFTSYRDGNGELYSIRLDGTGEARLTTTTTNETLPALSPDGRSVAYANDASGVTKVLVAARDLTGAARLGANGFGTPATIETSPAWNAASDRLVFVATAGPAGRASLFTAPAAGGAPPTLVPGSGSGPSELEPAWSPDGSRVAFTAPVGGRTQIFVRDLNASITTQLTSGDTNRGQPAWLPDGRLVFVTFASYTSAGLAWLDPAAPSVVHEIPVPGVSAQRPSAVRP